MLRSLIAIVVVLAIGAAGLGAYWTYVAGPERAAAGGPLGAKGPSGPVPVEAVEVKVAPVEVTTEAVGTLLSNEAVMLRPEVTGRVVAIGFEEGRIVKAGQVLIGLDDSVERAQLAQAESQVAFADADYDRAQELRRSNVGTQRTLDQAQAQRLTAKASIDLAKARLAKLTLLAPFDGVAGLRKVSVGDFVNAGTDLVNVEQIQPIKVDFRVPELFLPVLFNAQGQHPIQVKLDAFPGEVFRGKVYAINPLVDERGRAIVARAQIENPADPTSGLPRLRPGLFARVTLSLEQRDEALWVPEEALIPQGSRQLVYKVVQAEDGKKVAKQVEVKLGARRIGEVQLESGVAKGDVVVTAGVLKLRDNAPVVVAEPTPPTPSPQGRPAAAVGGGQPTAPPRG